jgi:HK97 family phage major capsid protein
MEFRLFNAIKGVAEGNVPEELRSMVNGNKITYRANEIVAGVDAQGGYNVPEEKKDLFMAIRNASVLNKIGATWFSNAVGDISIPKYAGSTCGWKGEIDAADNGAGAFSEVVLTPKRLTAYLDISKTFLAQDANSAEALLINDLAKAVSEKLDQTIFGAESGTTTRPAGLFNVITAETGTSLTAVDYDDILGLESKVEEKNGTDFIFIANPKVKYALKGVDMAEGYGHMVYAGGEIDGYKTVVSNSVNNKSILCMDPKDLAVATWDGIDITVDTVSRAINNEVRIVVNFLVDAKLRGDRISGAIFD